VVKMLMLVFWVVTPCGLVSVEHFSHENGGSISLRNIGIHMQVHMALQPRRPASIYLFTLSVVENLKEKREVNLL
jgi:hypothetical protein